MAGTQLTLHAAKTAERAELGLNRSFALHARGHFGSAAEILKVDLLHRQTPHICLAGLVLQVPLTYTWLLERKGKIDS